MKKNITAQEIINYFVEIGPILEEATWSGNYKIANKYTISSIKFFKILEKDIGLAKIVLQSLLKQECVETKITAAAYSLALNIFVEEALNILKKIETDPSAKIYRLNAEMTLKEWEKGQLTIYNKKKYK